MHDVNLNTKDKIRNFCIQGNEWRKKSIEMTIKHVELRISISLDFKASTKIDFLS